MIPSLPTCCTKRELFTPVDVTYPVPCTCDYCAHQRAIAGRITGDWAPPYETERQPNRAQRRAMARATQVTRREP